MILMGVEVDLLVYAYKSGGREALETVHSGSCGESHRKEKKKRFLFLLCIFYSAGICLTMCDCHAQFHMWKS